jgi:hypothetical protein
MGYQCQSVSSTSDTVIGATIPVLQGDILSSSDSMVVALKLSSRAGAHELKYIRYYDAKSAHKAYLTIQAIRNEDPAYNQALDAHSTELAIAGNVLLISRGQVGLADRVARKLSQ